MKRRELIALGITTPIWTTPVVEFVVLPAHARMSMDDPPDDNSSDDPPDDNSTDDPPPDDGPCRDGKVEICHHPAQQGTEPFEICVAEPAVDAHIRNHGDFVGKCVK